MNATKIPNNFQIEFAWLLLAHTRPTITHSHIRERANNTHTHANTHSYEWRSLYREYAHILYLYIACYVRLFVARVFVCMYEHTVRSPQRRFISSHVQIFEYLTATRTCYCRSVKTTFCAALT